MIWSCTIFMFISLTLFFKNKCTWDIVEKLFGTLLYCKFTVWLLLKLLWIIYNSIPFDLPFAIIITYLVSYVYVRISYKCQLLWIATSLFLYFVLHVWFAKIVIKVYWMPGIAQFENWKKPIIQFGALDPLINYAN